MRAWHWALLALAGALAVAARAVDPALEESAARDPDPEAAAREYLQRLNAETGAVSNRATLAEWGYAANITDSNLKKKLEVSAEAAAFQKEKWHETVRFPWRTFRDPDVKRQFQKYSILGTAALPPEKFEKLEKLVSDMQTIYSTAKICDYQNQTKCDLSLEPELVELLSTSRDAGELRHAWVEWRHASGEKCRGLFERYVALSNEAAVLNNFTDLAAMWQHSYESDDFEKQVQDLWTQLRPLYEQLHAYVRRRLREQYGEAEVTRDGPIPAHLLGEMWSSTWGNTANVTAPFPKRPAPDVSDALKQQGYTPVRMFRLAEEFFTSINMSAMPEKFWERSILEKPTDREIVCHASAWDFYDGQDFRIKQCTRVDMEHLFVAHHEMGHVEYFLQYKDQPVVYREGANPGFHEAVGDVMSLSVSTPKHLRKVGLLPEDEAGAGESGEERAAAKREALINYLFLQALQKVAFLPFGYLMDLWRWDVFRGRITSDEYNCRWWDLRERYQGIEPPVDRTEEDFDPGAKYHIIASVPYIRYFVSYVIQFQFHKALCEEAGEYVEGDPEKTVYNCDIHGSTAAGNKLKRMLALGSSRPWPEALEAVTGTRRMDAAGLLAYFAPLHDWLKEENKRTGEHIGWKPSKKVCVSTRDELERVRGPPTPTEQDFSDAPALADATTAAAPIAATAPGAPAAPAAPAAPDVPTSTTQGSES